MTENPLCFDPIGELEKHFREIFGATSPPGSPPVESRSPSAQAAAAKQNDPRGSTRR